MCLAIGLLLPTLCGAVARAADTKRAALQAIFRAQLGRHDRAAVASYLAYTDLPYGHEWCAAFVSYCFAKYGSTSPKTPWSPALFPNARLRWSVAQARGQPDNWQVGMVWGIYIAAKKRIGHVGFVDGYTNGVLTTVEGNTSDPQGLGPHGVYRKRRPWRTIQKVADWLE